MRVLLDTHTLLWVSSSDSRLSSTALEVLEDRANDIILSVVSAWEIAIKYSRGRMPELGSDVPELWIPTRIREYGLSTLQISFEHAYRVAHLPAHHRDPFDRLLVSQAQVEGLAIVTNDERFTQYGVEVIW